MFWRSSCCICTVESMQSMLPAGVLVNQARLEKQLCQQAALTTYYAYFLLFSLCHVTARGARAGYAWMRSQESHVLRKTRYGRHGGPDSKAMCAQGLQFSPHSRGDRNQYAHVLPCTFQRRYGGRPRTGVRRG